MYQYFVTQPSRCKEEALDNFGRLK